MINKKLISSIFILFNIFFVSFVVSWSFSIQNFFLDTWDNFPGSEIQILQPWEKFEIEVLGQNNLWFDLENVYINIDFENNQNFNYEWINHKSRINSDVTADLIPSSAYSWSSWFAWEITNISNPVVQDWQFPNIEPDWSNNWFKVKQSASTYQNEIITYFTWKNSNDWTTIQSDIETKTIYLNVKPHIVDYYFQDDGWEETVNQVQWSEAESINFVMEVKDYNTCSNIEWWDVTADLSQLWLSSNEVLDFVECKWDGKTAIFKKSWITTNADTGDYTFNEPDHFTAIDEDDNVNDSDEPHFGDEWKTDNITLTVVPPGTPDVSIFDIEYDIIWWPDRQSSSFSFTGDQSWDFKISANSDGSCEWWTTIVDWTNYEANEIKTHSVSTGDLQEWSNTIYACVRNEQDKIWSSSFSITKDTTPPNIESISFTSSVTTSDPNVGFKCSEDGEYALQVWWSSTPNSWDWFSWWFSTNAGQSVSESIPNNELQEWTNDVYIFCKDEATNVQDELINIEKIDPPPSMDWFVDDFYDCGQDTEWLDGRDLCVEWSHPSELSDYDNFESFRIYVLPSGTSLDTSEHSSLWIVSDKNVTDWKWDESITEDSIWDSFQDGWEYLAWMYIQWSGWAGKWEEWKSDPATLSSDSIENPSVTKAEFTSDTNLRLDTDTTLSTDLSDHDASLIEYDFDWNSFSANNILSVDWSVLNLEISSLWGNTWATWEYLTILTWAIRADIGWFNNFQEFWDIENSIDPNIIDYSIDSTADFNDWTINWFSGSVDISWQSSEDLSGGWDTRAIFERTSWNTDSTSNFNITSSSLLQAWSQNTSIDLSDSLNCGTIYQTRFRWIDLHDNTWFSDYVTNIWFDNCAPSIPVLHTKDVVWSEEVDFSWDESTDDNWNGSGVESYDLEVYEWSSCEWNLVSEENTSNTFDSTTLSDGDYSWRVRAIDNVGNVSDFSDCDDFTVDTDVPTIDNQEIFDTQINSTSYTREWRTVQISADITNTDTENVWIDIASLAGNNDYDNINCENPVSSVSCANDGNNYKFEFDVWFAGSISEWTRQARFTFANEAWLNTWTQLVSTTVDNTNPVLQENPIISPEWAITYWWDEIQIEWKSIEYGQSGRKNIKFEYSTSESDFQDWNKIFQASTSWPRTWDISDFEWENDFQLRLTAKDRSHNTSVYTWDTFTIDRTPPEIDEDQINFEISWWNLDWKIFKEWDDLILNWNTWAILWAELPDNPLNLYYSRNWWDDFNDIESWVENNWTYTWSMPGITSSDEVLIQMELVNNFWNSDSANTDTFVVDNTDPTVSFEEWTPPAWARINDNGFDMHLKSSDNYMSGVYLKFENTSDDTFWNGDEYVDDEYWILICEDTWDLESAKNCDNIKEEGFSPAIANWDSYQLSARAVDKAWNIWTATTRNYTWKTEKPEIEIDLDEIFEQGWKYYFGANWIVLSWTANDSHRISSVELLIQNEDDKYWNWDDWQDEHYAISADTEWIDTNKTWSYEFLPEWNSGDEFDINVTVYDNSYKVNLTDSENITLVLDKTDPIIEDNIFTFDTNDLYAWWQSIDITWNQDWIYDDFSWLKTDPISLRFYDWDTWIDVVEDIENNWNYTWDLPENIDTTNARFKIIVEDNLWNTNEQNSDSFQIDSTEPLIEKVETWWDGYWAIDRLVVKFSKQMNMSTISADDFDIDKWISIKEISNISHNNEETRFVLRFDVATGTTATRPTLSWPANEFEDLAWNTVEWWEMQAENKANPVIMNAEIFDNVWDARFDQIQVEFSEDMKDTGLDPSVFSLSNRLSWLEIESVDLNSEDSSIIDISLEGQNNKNTNPWSMTLNFAWNSDDYVDLADNRAVSKSNIELVDKAKPILVQWFIKDSEWDFEADKIELIFSENISWDTNWFSFSEWELDNWNIEDNKISFDLSDIEWTDPEVTISYSPWNIKDLNWNALDTIDEFDELINRIPPKLMEAKTYDDNWNGKIDNILLSFSEDIDSQIDIADVSVDGLTVLDVYREWNSTVRLDIRETSIYNSWMKPNITIWENSEISDLYGNFTLAQEFTETQDGIWPVISSARFDWAWEIFLTFSENVDTELDEDDFVFEDAGGLSITEVDFTQWDDTAVLTVDNYEGINFGSSKISFVANQVEDEFGNTQEDTYFKDISSMIIINEIFFGDDWKEYIELRNLSDESVDISDWNIRNAGGGTLNIDEWTIESKWYFLIWTDEVNDILSVDLDLLKNDLNLDTDNELILEDDTDSEVDRVLSNVWKNDDSNVSVERLEGCANWLDSACWYDAQVSIWFDDDIYFWTPWSENIFDETAPQILDFSPENNTLFPNISWINAVFEYEDDISWIDEDSISLNIQRYDWNNWNDYETATVNTWTISNEISEFSISDIDEYGRYRLQFELRDNAGNIASQNVVFYIDNFSMSLSHNEIDLWILEADVLTLAEQELTVSIQTIWVWFELNHSHPSDFWISNWNGNLWYWADITQDWLIQNVSDYTFTEDRNINTNGELNEYEFTIRYWALIESSKPAWIYSVLNDLDVQLKY